MPFVKRHRDYYKYDYKDWTQPVLSSNTGYGKLTSSGISASQCEPYSALNGVASGAPSTYQGWIPSSSTGWWKWELPVKLSISAMKFYNPYAYYDVSTSGQFFIDEGITPLTEAFSTGNSDWASLDLTVINDTPTNVIYFKKTGGGSHGGIGELKVTAREQISVTGTESDHDYYIDRNKLYQLATVKRSYYKYDDTPVYLSLANSNNSSALSNGNFYYHAYKASTKQTYTLTKPVKANKLFLTVTPSYQSNAYGDFYVEAITESGTYRVVEKSYGTGGNTTSEEFTYEFDNIENIKSFTIYCYSYSGSESWCYGGVTVSIYHNSQVELNVNGSDIYQDWKQPILTANGTLGGDKFAVSSNVAQYSGNDVYYLFNGNTATSFHSTSGVTTGYIDLYNPKPLKITNILVNNQNSGGSENRASTSGNIYGSSNGSDWEQITSYTNTVQGINEQWNIDLSSNDKAYKYYRIESTAGGTGGYWTIGELTITAQELVAVGGTVKDADYYTSKIVNYKLYAPSYEVISQMFSVSEELQTYVVPEGVNKLNVVCTASRGGNVGGAGGSVKCDLSVTPGDTLYIMVGAIPSSTYTASYNASDIRIGGTEYENRIIVAGGGGSKSSRGAAGGAGGGLIGADGTGHSNAYKGYGGTQTAGGAGGSYAAIGEGHSHAGGTGTFGLGGSGASCSYCGQNGAGGAGWYGGGAGAAQWNKNGAFAAGGGGGSSYTDDTLCENVVHLQGVNGGDGYVKISYIKELK